MTLYKYKEFSETIELVNRITAHSGPGHSCGTWGGNSTSSNVTWEHLLNYTWVSYPIPSTQPSDVELFGSIMYED